MISKAPSCRAITRELHSVPQKNGIVYVKCSQKYRHLLYPVWFALVGATHLEMAELLIIQVSSIPFLQSNVELMQISLERPSPCALPLQPLRCFTRRK